MRHIKLILLLLFCSCIKNALWAQNCSVNSGIDATYCFNDSIVLKGTKGGLVVGGITWTQVSGPSASIGSPNALNTPITNFASGTLVFAIAANCADGSKAIDYVTITILPKVIANAGRDTALCPGAFNLSGNTLNLGETGAWTFLNNMNAGAIGITNINSPTSSAFAYNTNGGITTLRWTVTNSSNCKVYDDIDITNYGGIMPVSAGADIYLNGCYTTSTSTPLNGSFGGIGLGGQSCSWTAFSGPSTPVFSNSGASNTQVYNLVQGTYKFVYTVSGPCANGVDTVDVIVPAPLGLLSPFYLVVDVKLCDRPNSIVISGSPPVFVNDTCRWEQISGPTAVTFTPKNASTTTVSNLNGKGGSRYSFRYHMANPITGCKDSQLASIYYIDTPYIQAGPDRALPCDRDSVNIPFYDTGGYNYYFELISGPYFGVTSTYTQGNVNFKNLNLSGIYTFRLFKKSLTSPSCIDAYDDVNILVSKTPTVSNAGSNQILHCGIDTTQVVGNVPVVGGGTWSQIKGPNISKIDSIHQNISTIRGLKPGKYNYRWLISGGSACTDKQDDVGVWVSDSLPKLINAGIDKTICYGSSISLNGNKPDSFVQGVWHVIQDSGVVFFDSALYNTSVTGLAKNKNYQFIWKLYNACGFILDTVNITTDSTKGPLPSNAGSNKCLSQTTTQFQLNGNKAWPGKGKWKFISGPSITIVDDTLENTDITGVSPGDYFFEWQINAGTCTPTRDTVNITVSALTTIANAGIDKDTCADNVILKGNIPAVGKGKWQLISGSGGHTITNPDSATTPVANLAAGSYIFEYKIINGACPSSSDQVKVSVAEPPTVPLAQVGKVWCNTTSINIAANRITKGKGYWTSANGNPSTALFTQKDSATTTAYNLIAGVYRFNWNAISTSGLCGTSVSARYDTIVLAANAGIDKEYCNILSTQLQGTPGTKGFWIKYSGGQVKIDTVGNNSAIAKNMLAAGSPYKFIYTIDSSFGCPKSSDTMNVVINDTSRKANAGADLRYCFQDTFFLNANILYPDSGIWTKVSGSTSGNFINIRQHNTKFVNATKGTYLFEWTSTRENCSNSDLMLVFNDDTSVQAFAGVDTVLCPGNNAHLNAGASTGNWSQFSGPNTATFSSLLNPQTTIRNLVLGTYHFVWKVSNGNCPSSSDTVQISIPYAMPTTANAGRDTALCAQDSLKLNGANVNIGKPKWSQISGISIAIDNDTLVDTKIRSIAYGSYMLQLKNTNGNCISFDTINIKNDEPPSSAIADNDTSYCLYSSLSIKANKPLVGKGKWTIKSGNGGNIIYPDSNITQLTGLNAGKYVFLWTVSNGLCQNKLDSIVVQLDSIPNISDAGPNQNLCLSSTKLAANKATTGVGKWYFYSGKNTPIVLHPFSDTSTINGLDSGHYQMIWRIGQNQCKSEDTMEIIMTNPQVNDQCLTPTIVSDTGNYVGDLCGANKFGSEPNTHGFGACNTLFYYFRTQNFNAPKNLNINITSMSNCGNGLRVSLFDSAACPGLGLQIDTTQLVTSSGMISFANLASNKGYILVVDEIMNPCHKTSCKFGFNLSGSALPITLIEFNAKSISSTAVKLNWKIINDEQFSKYIIYAESNHKVRFVSSVNALQDNSNSLLQYSAIDNTVIDYPILYTLKALRNYQLVSLSQVLVEKPSFQSVVKVFPNPANQKITVQTDLLQIKSIDIAVYDHTGKNVFSQTKCTLENNSFSINTANWSDGVYYLKVKIANKEEFIKAVIMHN